MIKTIIIALPLTIAAVAGGVYLVLAETAPKASEVKPAVAEKVEQGKRWFADRTAEIKRQLAQQTADQAKAEAKKKTKAQRETARLEKDNNGNVKNTTTAKPKATPKKKAEQKTQPAAEPETQVAKRSPRKSKRAAVTAAALFDDGTTIGLPDEPLVGGQLDPLDAQDHASRMQALQQRRLELDARLAKIGH